MALNEDTLKELADDIACHLLGVMKDKNLTKLEALKIINQTSEILINELIKETNYLR